MFTVRDATFAAAMSLAALSSAALSSAFAEMTVEVGGAPMYPSKNIIENAVNSKDHTTLLAAVKAADLVETLQGDGPFTVFAPVNKAFEKLPKGTVETLLKPENKATLTAVLTYHVIPGKISAADFVAAVKKGGGEATYKTVEGEELTVRQDGRRLEIIDAKGDKSFVTIADVTQKNGVIHVVDTVLLPKSSHLRRTSRAIPRMAWSGERLKRSSSCRRLPRSRPPGVKLRPVRPLIVMINGGYWETYGYNSFSGL